ncbi:MAG: hypothetical protein SVV80_03490 [Planctomycetota bacterium]|nr:hypothetical protein [Planctomycetota bacterium]
MSHQKRHLLEKVQVQIAAVAALAVVYFLIAPALSPWESGGATAFVPMGDYKGLVIFAVAVWALAAGCAVLTLSARPEGALLATLVAVAGFSFRSGSARTLLWRWDGNLPRLFALLSAEVLILAVVAIGAMVVIAMVRAGMCRLVPKLTRKYPAPTAKSAGERTGKTRVMHAAGAVIMELAIAMLLLVITFRSTDRGQVAFALAASFFVSALAAHQIFPIRTVVPLWFGPILMAVLVFALGWAGSNAGGVGPAWQSALISARNLPLRAALPVDWMALGAGGAVAGFWISSRMHENEKEVNNKKP